MSGASCDTVLKRIMYGGKKGRAAKRRLRTGWVWRHPSGGEIALRADVPLTREPITLRLDEGDVA